MNIDWQKVKIFIKPGVTDMRKQINGLSCIVESEMNHNLFTGNLYIFCNRNRTRLKILYWDKNGFCLWFKRLEKYKFPWPKNAEEARQISFEELQMLLNGIDFFNAHQKLTYQSVL